VANDRIYIVCKSCNRGRLLLKYYPSGSFATSDTVGDFMAAHLDGCHYYFGNTLDGDPKFWLATEADYDKFRALGRDEIALPDDDAP
jgi:hypothetical protein